MGFEPVCILLLSAGLIRVACAKVREMDALGRAADPAEPRPQAPIRPSCSGVLPFGLWLGLVWFHA